MVGRGGRGTVYGGSGVGRFNGILRRRQLKLDIIIIIAIIVIVVIVTVTVVAVAVAVVAVVVAVAVAAVAVAVAVVVAVAAIVAAAVAVVVVAVAAAAVAVAVAATVAVAAAVIVIVIVIIIITFLPYTRDSVVVLVQSSSFGHHMESLPEAQEIELESRAHKNVLGIKPVHRAKECHNPVILCDHGPRRSAVGIITPTKCHCTRLFCNQRAFVEEGCL